ncbi:hypothetical protein U0C82_16725 [Fulvimarina sp. 2208YS6-2-32]|uniref:DNA-directed DNA polymerase n=1 Tax=Fulvimarina uroteuthidis TaxID=3098149 RepID=A0ABU5I6S7_9HYPH|nr:hypothetical protein [Fulvimarina sp. 2208YS6-2-32]MDY8110787.1 hypothetical protein [Fulvimarina sp. 2208YS6-2-32]
MPNRIAAPRDTSDPARPKLVAEVGIDAEWVTRSDPLGENPYNQILSYQAVLHHAGHRVPLVVYPSGSTKRHRLSLNALLKRLVRLAITKRVLPGLPDRVEIYAHFLRADLTTFTDFWPRKREFDGFGRTFTARSIREVIDVSDEDLQGRRHSSEAVFFRQGKKPPHIMLCRFIDTMLLTPGRAGLAIAANIIGMEKVSLPAGYTIDRMDRLLKNDKAAFERYALHDAEIALEYGLRIKRMMTDAGLRRLPTTLASAGIGLLKLKSREAGIDLNKALGLEVVAKTEFHEGTGKYRTRKTVEASFERQIYEEFAAIAYQGGRGESYWFGPTPVGVFHDYDLPGAYTTAMCALRALDYENARWTRHVDDFGPFTVSAVRVKFRFSSDTRFPCLPVRVRETLVFPLEGISVCTGPEVFLARSMGAELEIIQGLIIPNADTFPIFGSFAKHVSEERRRAGKGTFAEKIWKEIGNSVYGKLAQGVKQKRVFDPRRGRYNEMPPSAITAAFPAAFVTGFIRAVLGEILNGVSKDRLVVSATTDGLLTNAPFSELVLDGPLCMAFRRLRMDTFGTDDILEEKHRVRQVVALKTRGQLTGQSEPGHPIVLAKAGVKPDVPSDQHNEYMLRLFLDREPDQRHHQHSLIGLQEQWKTESDLVAVTRHVRLNLEYDFKRRPHEITENSVRLPGPLFMLKPNAGASTAIADPLVRTHVAFDTVPFATADEAFTAMERFRGWTRSYKRVLKTPADVAAWQAYQTLIDSTSEIEGVGIRSDGSYGHLYRQFLRALVRDEWGLGLDGRSYQDVVDWLRDRGFESSRDDFKNAKRKGAKLAPQSIVVDEDTIPLLQAIAGEFTDMDLVAMIHPDHLERAYEALNLKPW